MKSLMTAAVLGAALVAVLGCVQGHGQSDESQGRGPEARPVSALAQEDLVTKPRPSAEAPAEKQPEELRQAAAPEPKEAQVPNVPALKAPAAIALQTQGEKPAETPGKENACESMAKELIAANKDLPQDISSLSGDKLLKVQTVVDQTILRGREFAKNCEGSPEYAQALFAVARLMVLNNQRAILDATRAYEASGSKASLSWTTNAREKYFDEIVGYLKQAKKSGAELDPDLAGELDRLQAQCYWFTGRFSEAAAGYRRAIKAHPTDPNPDQTLCALISSLLKQGQLDDREQRDSTAAFTGTLKQCDLFVERYPRSTFMPHILHMKAKAYIGLGQLENAAAHLRKFETLHHQAVAGEAVELGGRKHIFSSNVRSDFDLYLDQLSFYYGFLDYAQGKIPQALQHLNNAVKLLTAKKEQGAALRPASNVFLSRTHEVVNVLENLQGKPATPLEIEGGWIDDSLSLEEERGNVVAIYFATQGNPRYFPFARILEDYYQKHWHDGFRAMWMTWPKGRNDIPGQKMNVLNERRALGVTFPVGMDLSEDFRVSRGYNASIGGGTLVVIDREGNYAWYKIDPTERDMRLAYHVFDRLLAK